MWLDGYIDWFVVLIAVWLCAVGGVIGSFLNVVIYRLPLGMSLVRPASRCPYCLTPIRWYDNLPVIGWLWLRGRCRACAAPISARYPTIEALVAMFFLSLAASEFCFGGMRDPISAARAGFHVPLASDLSAAPVWMRYWLQIALGVTLLAAGLIERDDHCVPRRFFLASQLLSVAVPFVWRGARPWPFEYGMECYFSVASPMQIQPLDLMLGAWTGLAVGLAAWPAMVSDRRGHRPMWLAMLAIGVTLGWQLTAVIGVSWLAWLGVSTGFSRSDSDQRRGGILTLAIITWGILLAWRPLFSLAVKVFDQQTAR